MDRKWTGNNPKLVVNLSKTLPKSLEIQNLAATNPLSLFTKSVVPKKPSDSVMFNSLNVITFLSRYELLFGVTTADATFALNNRQLEYGLEPEERNRIFSEFVSVNYGLHQREIFAAIVNEYTDWQSATQHPVNIRDQTLEALTDAHYVAPILETGDYHSSLNARSWFYVFDYQTKNSYFKQVRIAVLVKEVVES